MVIRLSGKIFHFASHASLCMGSNMNLKLWVRPLRVTGPEKNSAYATKSRAHGPFFCERPFRSYSSFSVDISFNVTRTTNSSLKAWVPVTSCAFRDDSALLNEVEKEKKKRTHRFKDCLGYICTL